MHFLVCYGILLLPLLSISQESIPERARKMQLHSKLWSALGTDLKTNMGCTSESVLEKLRSQFSFSNVHLRSFLIYANNYSIDSLQIHQVLYRYPHYNKDSVEADIATLEDLELLTQTANGYQTTSVGNEVLNHYWQLRLAEATNCKRIDSEHLTALITVVKKITAEVMKIERFRSIRLRISNRPDGFDGYPLLLQANEYQRDLTTIFNDNGHYRIDFLIESNDDNRWQELDLSPLAKELLGATRNNRLYAITRCYNQRNWRVGKNGCDKAITELHVLDLIGNDNDSIYQTAKGHALFTAANELADERLYAAWKNVTNDEFEALLKTLDWIAD